MHASGERAESYSACIDRSCQQPSAASMAEFDAVTDAACHLGVGTPVALRVSTDVEARTPKPPAGRAISSALPSKTWRIADAANGHACMLATTHCIPRDSLGDDAPLRRCAPVLIHRRQRMFGIQRSPGVSPPLLFQQMQYGGQTESAHRSPSRSS